MIHIDEQTCIGCTKCTKVCPGNLLVMKNGKSTSREPRACWSCTACIKECPVQAIALYTGADAGAVVVGLGDEAHFQSLIEQALIGMDGQQPMMGRQPEFGDAKAPGAIRQRAERPCLT